jgi:hypothetical protein
MATPKPQPIDLMPIKQMDDKAHKPKRKSRFSGGYDFEREIDDSLTYIQTFDDRFWFMKLADTHAYNKFAKILSSKLPQYAFISSFTMPKVPADFLIIRRGRAIFVECKSSRQSRYDLDMFISDHQHVWGHDIEILGEGSYFYILCNRQTPRHHYCILLTRTDKAKAVAYQQEQNYGALTWNEILSFSSFPEFYKKKKPFQWDLRMMFDYLDNDSNSSDKERSINVTPKPGRL